MVLPLGRVYCVPSRNHASHLGTVDGGGGGGSALPSCDHHHTSFHLRSSPICILHTTHSPCHIAWDNIIMLLSRHNHTHTHTPIQMCTIAPINGKGQDMTQAHYVIIAFEHGTIVNTPHTCNVQTTHTHSGPNKRKYINTTLMLINNCVCVCVMNIT